MVVAPRDEQDGDFSAQLDNMNVPEKRGLSGKLRRVRRKPGLEQLGIPGDDTVAPSLWKKGHVRASTRSDSTTSAASDIVTNPIQDGTQSISQGHERRKSILQQQRALWEATIPRLPVDHIGYFSSGHGLDHIQHSETM